MTEVGTWEMDGFYESKEAIVRKRLHKKRQIKKEA
jgi:hypothetical protein